MKYIGILLMAIALIAMPAVAQANFLSNPGFEYGTGEDADDWEEWSWAQRRDSYAHGDSTYSLHGWAASGTDNQGAWQSVSVAPGTTYFLTGYILSPNGTGNDHSPLTGGASAFLSIEWDGGQLDSDAITATTDAVWIQKQIASWTAPEGITSATIVTKIQRADGSSGDVYFDDLDFDVVPEPASLLLLGTGLVGLFGLSRKKRA